MARQKKNCWEEKGCDRFPGGNRSADSGPCPATTCVPATGINGGVYGGRACWAIANTLCEGQVAADFVEKMRCCLECSFYVQVRTEEGNSYQDTAAIQKELDGYQVF